MRRALVLFGFALAGCAGAAAAPHTAGTPPPPVAVVKSAAPAAPTVASCQATPSTVYGDEAVTFVLEASSAGPVDVELFDQRGQSIARARPTAPGDWQPPNPPSGDFFLKIGPSIRVCAVTVNRELSRERAAASR